MKRISLLFLLFAVLGFHSCEDDIVGEQESKEIFQEPTTIFTSSVSGIVTTTDGEAMPEVTVRYNNTNYYTDENGYFKIENVKAGEDGGILKFEAGDYFENYKYFIPTANRQSFMRVHMVNRDITGKISGSAGGSLTLPGEGRIEFPESAFVDENNVSYEGEVSVYAHWFDPSSSAFSPSMPGDLRAIQSNGEQAQLATYGMMAVELESSNGSELQLADGKKATLTFPVPNFLLNNAPSTIETWSLNESTVYWEEEDVATLEGNTYVAEVSHFSFWNCDAPFPLVNITGKVVDQDGNPLKYARICIVAFNGSQTGYGWTDSQGVFAGKVPRNQELILQIKDECGNVVFEELVGPFSNNASFGEIVVTATSKTTLVGQLVCNGMPVTSGYAKITVNEDIFYIAEVDEQGFFEQPVFRCEISELKVQGFDIDNARVSDELSFTNPSGGTLDVGELEVCSQLDEYIIFKIDNGDEVLITDPSADIRDAELHIRGNDTRSSVSVRFHDPAIGDNSNIEEITGQITDGQNQRFTFECERTDCVNGNINLTALGMEGEYIIGTFMSEDPNGNTIMGEFRVLLDNICFTVNVSGRVWLDVNEDGIRQPGEPGLAQIPITVTCVGSSGSCQSVRLSGPDGRYETFRFCPNEVILQAEIPDLYDFTLKDQGGDDLVDSDIDESGLQLNVTQSLTSVDIGLVYRGTLQCFTEILNFPTCDGEAGAVAIQLAGLPPYVVSVTGNGFNETLSSSQNVVEFDNMSAGVFNVTVEDAALNTCDYQFTLVSADSIFCNIVVDNASCANDDGSLFVEVEGDPANFSFIWNTGDTGQSLDGMPEGDYSVTVTDNNGCQAVCSTALFSEQIEVFISAAQISCESGIITTQLIAEVFGNINQIDFSWSTGENQQDIIVEDEGLEEYIVVVSDLGSNCFAEAIYTTPLPTTQIGGRIWTEEAGGQPDVFDQGIETGRDSVLIDLYEASNLTNPMRTTATVDEGFYEFTALAAGQYIVKVRIPEDLTLVEKDQGMNDSIDSDFDPVTGETDIIQIDGCEPDYSIYAGFNRI